MLYTGVMEKRNALHLGYRETECFTPGLIIMEKLNALHRDYGGTMEKRNA